MQASTRRCDPVLVALLACSLALNVFLSLRRNTGEAPRPPSDVASLHVGDKVPTLAGRAYDGTPLTVGFDRPATVRALVVYVFAKECRWCLRNADNFRALVRSSIQYRFVGVPLGEISTSDAEQWRSKHPGAVLLQPSRGTIAAYHMRSTPMTVVVSPSGTVQAVWQGAYTAAIAKSIEKFFAVSLPGLAPADLGDKQD